MEKLDQNKFKKVFGCEYTRVYRAPARINLIGEHIDYNGGKVFPCAISLYIYAYVSDNDNGMLNVYSENLDDMKTTSFENIIYNKESGWANYPFGMAEILRKEKGVKYNKGLNIYYISNIPLGSGVSSSAALLDLSCLVYSKEYNVDVDKKELAILARMAECDFCGLSCGIMDQAAISLGKKNQAMLLDCANFSFEYYPLELGEYSLVVMQTNKQRKLTESKYNERVSECNKALSIIKTKYNVEHLCDLDVNDLDDIYNLLNDEVLFKRVKHCVTENNRTILFKEALLKGDILSVGTYLTASDMSLKDDYEVTGLHLDTITSAARKFDSCIGARMTGAGFGGCSIAVIKKGTLEEFSKFVDEIYFKETNIHPTIYEVDIVDGVEVL